MVAMRIEVSEELERRVREQAAAEGVTPEVYAARILERDAGVPISAELERVLAERVRRGGGQAVTREDFDRLRQQVSTSSGIG